MAQTNAVGEREGGAQMSELRASTDMSRRGLITAGFAGATGLMLGTSAASAGEARPRVGSDGLEEPVDHHDVLDLTEDEYDDGLAGMAPLATVSRNHLNGTPLYYEVTGGRTTFTFKTIFYDQLVAWRNNIGNYVPTSWGGAPKRIYSYGAYVNKPGMHGQARAFDIASIRFTDSTGALRNYFNCRFDRWRNASDMVAQRRRYWAFSASLHHRFQHVLTYLYNAQHHNHIHVDNAIYGRYTSAMLQTGSSAQVQHVQAVCRYIWGHPTVIDGIWGPQTRSHSTAVLRRVGIASGTIVGSNYNWRMFNHRTLLHGTGKQTF